ncbi:hypothetical protein [Flocculibacter collagenilyticus]|uniref:hypothetical protein n=1 Tax=Flocculibacter collagenilyticus TaxID=2744479 RepID=UPI0018F79DCD|nr:hypothetical protein [Flocculibacter collagenilyticus]
MLINPFNLTQYQKVLFHEPDNGYEHNDFYLVRTDDYLAFLYVCEADELGEHIPGYQVFQFELPINAASWLADAIENKFWKSAELGGLPSGVYHYEEVIEGENLYITREMNAGAKGQNGFMVINSSRDSLIFANKKLQKGYLTDKLLLDKKLLEALKQINSHC